MKRFLALLLTLVMLVSVCGLQAFAADGDTPADTGDELVVYTRSGATRTFHVGDTFSYTYWFRLTSGSVNKITGHVLYDSECLTVNADGCKFPNMSSASTKNNAGDFEFRDSFTTSSGGVFATAAPQVMANISFTVTRGGTAYLTTMIERLEIRKTNDDKSELVTNFQNKTWSPAMYSTFDYLQDEKPTAASKPLSASSDVAWYYAVDAGTGAPVPAGVTFELTGTAGNGEHIERTAVSDAYGFVGFGTVPYGTYYIQTRTPDGAETAYIVNDGSRVLPDVQDGKLQLNHTLHYRTADPSELRSVTVTFEWTNELIAPDELYTKDRPSSVYMELSRNNDSVVVAHRSSAPEDGVAVFENLPIHDDNGNEITYVLTTSTLQHYDAQVTRTDTGFHINFAYLNDHTWETTRTEPTCTEDGSIVSVCKDCGATDRVVLPATGHKLVTSGHDATCTQSGYVRYMCSQCGYWYEKKTPALGHSWGDWEVDREATSRTDGVKHHTCTRCGETEVYAIPSANHKHTMEEHVVAPTCTEQGYTELRCVNSAGLPCGKTYVIQGSEKPALGHTYGGNSGITTIIEPTCTTTGLKEYHCTRCGDTYTEILSQLGHDYELQADKSSRPDCTQPGTEYYVCGRCKDVKLVRLPALGHDWSDWIVDQQETDQADGLKHRICKTCGERQDAVIPKLEHVHNHLPTKVEPTCEEQGYTRYTCSCGDTYIEQSSYVPALGHVWVETARQEPTEKTVGVITYTCQRCTRLRYEYIPKTEPIDKWKNPYRDVRSTAWYYEAVAYVTRNNLMVGTGTMTFSPDEEMNRAMLVMVLYRLNGTPSVAGMTAPFEDVPQDAWYADAVTWAYNCGVASGTSATTFSPMADITREQMMTMFYGYAAYMDYNTMAVADLSVFPDCGDVSSWAEAKLGWAVANSLIKGVQESDGVYLRPRATATRAEAAAILRSFDQWRVNAVVTGK